MPDTKYKALVIGSSGLIGIETINLLLNNNKYSIVYSISRSKLPIQNDKLVQIISDIDSVEIPIRHLHIDHLFSCIGTTAFKTPDKKQYYSIDLKYPQKVANILHSNGCDTICLVSSVGANASSKNFYLKLKGDVEDAIKDIGFKSTHIFRPSLLLGNRSEIRLMEKIAQFVYPLLNIFLIGRMKDYRSVQAHDVASAMVNVAISKQTGEHIYQTQHIKELA